MAKKKTTSYYQAKRSVDALELMKHPYAYALFSQIAYRAKRTGNFSAYDLEIGEALIGDFKSIGLTEQKYRTAKKNLEKWGLITTRATNRGTIAKIINSDVFDINIETNNEQANRRETDRQRSDNDQVTTNKNDKKRRMKRNILKGKKGHLTSTPDEFPVTEQMIEYAKKKKYLGDINILTEAFITHHRAKGSKFVNWYAAWQKWLQNELRYYPERNVPPGHQPLLDIKPTTYAQAQDAEQRQRARWLLERKDGKIDKRNGVRRIDHT